jgi:hypothetical protein
LSYESYIKIDEFADAIFSIFEKERLMAMMSVYLDESGTHDQSPIVVVGGYVASVVQWKHFQAKWSAALKEEEISCFHMNKFESSVGEFEGWTEERKRPFFQKLSQIILRHVSFGIGMAVVKKDYEGFSLEYRKGISPRTFGVLQCIRQLRWWAEYTRI